MSRDDSDEINRERMLSIAWQIASFRIINVLLSTVLSIAYKLLEIMLYGVLSLSFLVIIIYLSMHGSVPAIVEQIYILAVASMLGGAIAQSIMVYFIGKMRRSLLEGIRKAIIREGDT